MDRLWRLLGEPASGSALTDDAILAFVDDFDHRLWTNCESAAQGLIAAVAPICRLRSRLIGPLMRRALRPLVYLGYERAEQVQGFVGWFLKQESRYLPLEAVGRTWLEDSFAQHLGLVQQLLEELIRQTEAID
jgi:hypothetical protein